METREDKLERRNEKESLNRTMQYGNHNNLYGIYAEDAV